MGNDENPNHYAVTASGFLESMGHPPYATGLACALGGHQMTVAMLLDRLFAEHAELSKSPVSNRERLAALELSAGIAAAFRLMRQLEAPART